MLHWIMSFNLLEKKKIWQYIGDVFNVINVVDLVLRKSLRSRFKNFLKIAANIPQRNFRKTKKELYRVITSETKTSKNYLA